MNQGALIWIQVKKPEEIQFTTPLVEWFKSAGDGTSVYDFDNHSEAFIINSILDAVSGINKLILVIDAMEQDTGQVTKFLTGISRMKNPEALIFFNGRNEMIEKMAKVIAAGKFHSGNDLDKQKKIISEFLEIHWW